MLVDREELWFKVLTSRYGIERGRMRKGGTSESSWWREIVRIRDGVADIGGRLGGRRSGVGLTETAMSVGGRDVRGVSDSTS
ncbi:hypothetical protein TSUD_110330 [Trifolium subterraneum]|uniref:Uncharacterized protein n=1 Tax=Trifolium subterraneum TaxID=3900 RepID=A0A2Z6MMK2_TRISU|nr:hypothetical protein TSUD_110330 [Trifolium subterraneum]